MFHRLISLTLTVSIAAFAYAADAPQAFPRVGDYEVLRCDFHVHTPNSDGKLTPVQRVEEAIKFGYDAIAITDHGNFKSYEEARPALLNSTSS